MAGLNVQGRLWRYYTTTDDEVGGIVPTGTVLKELMFGRIEQQQATQVLLEQGLELPEIFKGYLYYTGDPIDIAPNDQLEIYHPPVSPWYNKRFRILGFRHSSHSDVRRFVEVTMRRHEISRTEVLQ